MALPAIVKSQKKSGGRWQLKPACRRNNQFLFSQPAGSKNIVDTSGHFTGVTPGMADHQPDYSKCLSQYSLKGAGQVNRKKPCGCDGMSMGWNFPLAYGGATGGRGITYDGCFLDAGLATVLPPSPIRYGA